MEILFYERIAGNICGVNPELLFVETRKSEVALARQFCMSLRMERLKFTCEKAAERYGKDHSTALYAKKSINNYKFTKDNRYQMYLQFVSQCLKEPLHMYEYNSVGEVSSLVHEKVQRMGYSEFISDASDLFIKMSGVLLSESNDNIVKQMLEECHAKILELKYLYE